MARYIDAEKLIAEFDKCLWRKKFDKALAEVCVSRTPTSDVRENVHGEWIDAYRSTWDGTRYWYRECSECGYERDDDNPDKDTNFCPNCGAEMRGERR